MFAWYAWDLEAMLKKKANTKKTKLDDDHFI